MLLCHPHNPLGLVHPREQLAELAEIAARHDALVLSDEVHAPLTHSDAEFLPFLAVSDAAREVGVCISSARKAWNIAGLKAAFILAEAGTAAAERLAGMPESVHHRLPTSACTPRSRRTARRAAGCRRGGGDRGQPTLAARAARRAPPEAVMHEPRAGYLAWST